MTKREIKFRCFDKFARVMLYEDFHISSNGFVSIISQTGEYDYELFQRCEYVMQYTGVRDMDGNEIYEGDICEHNKLGVMEIKWIRCEFVARSADGKFITTVNGKWLKIVDNIYENPELINIK